MSATYNWAYKPGVANKYSFTIASGADNVKPSNACYIALFGNDSTGNGSRQYPYRTIAAGVTNTPANGYLIIGPGTYREGDIPGTPINGKSLVGDGDVNIDISYYSSLYPDNGTGTLNSYNIKFKGNTTNSVVSNSAGTQGYFTDCVFDGCNISGNGNLQGNIYLIRNCVFCNISVNLNFNSVVIRNCTFYNNTSININSSSAPDIRSIIFYKCNINFNGGGVYPAYSLFYQCNFRFAGSAQFGGALYPGTPTGYTYISDIATLRSSYTAAYSAFTNALPYCVVTDPIFNNINIGDVTLAFDSSAKNLSYNGTYIGAHSIAGPVQLSATEASGNFDFSTAVNLTINDNSLTITDTTQNSQVDTKLIANPTGRELSKLSVSGITAD
ncbi:MAG: hypothetical protein JST50_04795, partial [Bacteroidetes bacterium]|nr:hypothetical protein [Bacteroidota bacterium]